MIEQHAPAAPTVRVWDLLVRVAHWMLATSVLFAWLTRHGGGAWHEYLGYLSLCVVGVRLVWGWRGSEHARFAAFLRGPRQTLIYVLQVLRRREPRCLGHNPLGGWMIVALLGVVALVGASGWLYTTDRYWGVAWVESVHRHATNVLLVLVALHVAGVLYGCVRHRENLIGAMLHGRKQRAETDPSVLSGT
jgi:cytochrome b